MSTSRPILYSHKFSSPSRSVWLTANELGLDLENRQIVISNKEHLTPEFLKLNPQHTIPTLVDHENVIWDSHAINNYLITKYENNYDHPLYPQNPYIRAKIDQRLYFDTGILFARNRQLMSKIFFYKNYKFDYCDLTLLRKAYDYLEIFLENQFIVGNSMTVADIACVTTVTQLELILPIKTEDYPRIRSWLNRMAKMDKFYELNTKHLIELREVLSETMDKNRLAAAN